MSIRIHRCGCSDGRPAWPIWTSLASVSATRNPAFSTVGSPTPRQVRAGGDALPFLGTCCEADRLLRGRVFVDLHRVVPAGDAGLGRELLDQAVEPFSGASG